MDLQEPFIGQIMLFGGVFAPRGWLKCEGQKLEIDAHPTLFSVLGTTYGGDGRKTFALPDLRGRVPVGAGHGPDLSRRYQGTSFGDEVAAVVPSGAEEGDALLCLLRPPPSDKVEKDAQRAAKVSTNQPSLVLNYIISLEGAYPERDQY